MKVSTLILICLACLMAGTVPGAAHAQSQEGPWNPPVLQTHVLSGNPFLLLGEWANVEFEQKVSDSGTVGVAGSMVSLEGGDVTYKSLNGFFRHYPGGALSGFYLGGRLGVHHGSDEGAEGHVYGFGIDVGYSWLLGSSGSFYLGMGIGATRFFGGDMDSDGRVILPSLRLMNVGYAF